MKLVGLDFESSGTDPWGTAAPIQIGIALGSVPAISYLIGGWNFALNGEYVWGHDAAEVHQLNQKDLRKAEPAWKVDIRLSAEILDHIGPRMWNITVGWNVAGFDRQFITRHFPNLNRLFSYRTIDLNALVLAQADGDVGKYKRIKSASKDYAAERLASEWSDARWHDAGYDAEAALYSYEYLIQQVGT